MKNTLVQEILILNDFSKTSYTGNCNISEVAKWNFRRTEIEWLQPEAH